MLVTIEKRIKNKKYVKLLVALLYSALFFVLLFGFIAEKVNQDLSDSMIRLHIVANSDSTQDQALKYSIRDAVVKYMTEHMDGLESKRDATDYIKTNIKELEQIANDVIAKEGAGDYAVASFGKFPFPSKQYANIILPAGFYESLKIEVGRAEGQNWWCVMFPPLCFTEDTQGELDEEYMSILQNELTEDEFYLITSKGKEGEMPVEIKFKIVEIFQQSKIKLAGLLKQISAN
ncbi:MAG TPA: stage II sporulation protein R [Thermoclostridium sp.]|nr:stage II sporulation protein R [Thermoclostridium sp.]